MLIWPESGHWPISISAALRLIAWSSPAGVRAVLLVRPSTFRSLPCLWLCGSSTAPRSHPGRSACWRPRLRARLGGPLTPHYGVGCRITGLLAITVSLSWQVGDELCCVTHCGAKLCLGLGVLSFVSDNAEVMCLGHISVWSVAVWESLEWSRWNFCPLVGWFLAPSAVLCIGWCLCFWKIATTKLEYRVKLDNIMGRTSVREVWL